MSKHSFQATTPSLVVASSTAPVVAQEQQEVTVVRPATLRATRVARIQVALMQRRIADKQARFAHATQVSNAQAYMLKAAQLAAQYGMPAPTQSVRSVPTAQRHPASAAAGACKRVHAIAAQCNGERKATLAACAAAGINPATAATQFAKYKKALVA